MALAILQHTPVWVWAILLALLTLGWRQTLPRVVSVRRITLLPLVMLALSLAGVVSAFASDSALAAWALGVLAAATLALRAGHPRAARWVADAQVFRLPGSWAPLALMLSIFCIKFAVGVSLALQPELRSATSFALAASLAYGAASGVFAGRALVLWRLARRDMQLSAA